MKKPLLGLLAGIVLFGVIGLFLPAEYSVERSVLIAASPAQIHELVDDLTRWPDWMPWSAMDKSIELAPGAVGRGAGATLTMHSPRGTADVEVKRSDPSGVDYVMAIEMAGNKVPWQGSIHYTPTDAGTRVTWIMHGLMDVPVLGGYFALSADRTLGVAMDRGLAQLRIACGT